MQCTQEWNSDKVFLFTAQGNPSWSSPALRSVLTIGLGVRYACTLLLCTGCSGKHEQKPCDLLMAGAFFKIHEQNNPFLLMNLWEVLRLIARTRVYRTLLVEKHVENRRIRLEFSGFLCTFAVRKKSGVSICRC